MHNGAGFQLTSTGGRSAVILQSFWAQVEAQAAAMILTGTLYAGRSPYTQGWQKDTQPYSHFTKPMLTREAFPEDHFYPLYSLSLCHTGRKAFMYLIISLISSCTASFLKKETHPPPPCKYLCRTAPYWLSMTELLSVSALIIISMRNDSSFTWNKNYPNLQP